VSIGSDAVDAAEAYYAAGCTTSGDTAIEQNQSGLWQAGCGGEQHCWCHLSLIVVIVAIRSTCMQPSRSALECIPGCAVSFSNTLLLLQIHVLLVGRWFGASGSFYSRIVIELLQSPATGCQHFKTVLCFKHTGCQQHEVLWATISENVCFRNLPGQFPEAISGGL